MKQNLVGTFETKERAERAIEQLMTAGIPRESISLLRKRDIESTVGSSASTDEMNAEGAASGAAMGGLAGFALGLAALALPGVGPILAAGPLAVALGGAGAGAIAGGLIGSLTDMGVPEDEAYGYSEAVQRGATLLLVEADDTRIETVRSILTDSGAYAISTRASASASPGAWQGDGWSSHSSNAMSSTDRTMRAASPLDGSIGESSRMSDRMNATMRSDMDGVMPGDGERMAPQQDGLVIPIVEEEVTIDKREVEKGCVGVRSRVVTTPVEEEVRLREEKLRVERRPADRPATEADFDAASKGEIRLTEKAEEAIVEKKARVVEEVVVGKDVKERSKSVKSDVRRTEVEVDEDEVDLPNARRQDAQQRTTHR